MAKASASAYPAAIARPVLRGRASPEDEDEIQSRKRSPFTRSAAPSPEDKRKAIIIDSSSESQPEALQLIGSIDGTTQGDDGGLEAEREKTQLATPSLEVEQYESDASSDQDTLFVSQRRPGRRPKKEVANTQIG
jgi:hypothetical protein